jgi:predicted PurR-regulated permease PerM
MAIFSHRRYSWFFILWVLIGIIVAWEKTYITVYLLKLLVSAILAIFLWPLVLLGVDLHIH